MTFLLVSIPEIGHMTPMMGTARALQGRGHVVYLASFEHARSMVQRLAPGVHFLTLGRSPLGEGGGDGELEMHRRLSDPKIGGIEQLRLIVDDFGKQYQSAMFKGLAHRLIEAGCEGDLLPGARAAVLREAEAGRPGVEQAEAAWLAQSKPEAGGQGSSSGDLSGGSQEQDSSETVAVTEAGDLMHQRPDVIVFDTTTLCGLEAAEAFQLPAVAHCILAGIGNTLLTYGEHRCSAAKHVPMEDFGLGAMPEKMSWWQLHVTNPLMKWLSRKLANAVILRMVNERRITVGLVPLRSFKALLPGLADGVAVVCASSWLSVGPVSFDAKRVPGVESLQVSQFLDAAQAASEKVVYVALGTFVFMTPGQVTELARSMSPRWAPPGVRFLWSLRPELRVLIKPEDEPDPARVLVLPWVEQVPVLFHPAVAAFVSHGGMGSTNEGMSAGKPILCIPFLGDQPINAQHIVNRGCGLMLTPKRMTAQRLAKSVTRLLLEPEFTQVARNNGEKLRAMEGAPHAARVIEGLVKPQK